MVDANSHLAAVTHARVFRASGDTKTKLLKQSGSELRYEIQDFSDNDGIEKLIFYINACPQSGELKFGTSRQKPFF